MLFELTRENFYKAKSLIGELNYNLSILSVMEGINNGRILVNNAEAPSAATFFTSEGMYFCGDSTDESFNAELNSFLKNTFFKNPSANPKLSYLAFHETSEWLAAFDTIFEGLYPMEDERYYYQLSLEDWSEIALDKNVVRIDKELLSRKDIEIPDDIEESLQITYGSYENFYENGFGFGYLLDDKIVSWCLTDCTFKDRCEIGIETDEDYRQRGYSIATVTAALAYFKQSGIKTVGWHCFKSNVPSWSLSEKLGFSRLFELKILFGWYDLDSNNLINGNHYLNIKKDYSKSLDFYEKAFAVDYGFGWQYFNAACTSYKLGDMGKAKNHYKTSLAKGFSEIEKIKSLWFSQYVYHEDDALKIEAALKAL